MRIPGFPNGVGWGAGLLIGAAAVLLAPVVLPALAGVVKSLAKAGIKGGLIVYEKGKVAIEEAKESIEDLTAEARAELSEETKMEPAHTRKKSAAAAEK